MRIKKEEPCLKMRWTPLWWAFDFIELIFHNHAA